MSEQLMFLPVAAGPGGVPEALNMFIYMALILGILYFMMIRPQQRKEKERRKMIDSVTSGQRVLFSGGIIGTVTNVKESILVIKIADNVKIEVARGAVTRVLDRDEKLGKDDTAS